MGAGLSSALLDTSAVLLISDEARAATLPEQAAISVITLGELSAGVLLARSPKEKSERRRRLRALREAFIALPVDEVAADAYGAVLATARRTRRTVAAADLLIIATAIATGRTLHTADHAQARLAEVHGAAVSPWS